ncbi:MAG: 8-oxo-dGTP diphosphatase [Candidatus Pacebacteria bacterium]|nr:8-oxo-dGTP diphosphatase [Candidatus Paceibacterota bacterium]
MNKKILTLCIIHQHPKILLGMKKRGHGEGKWNGFGGKVEQGETIEEAARRETKEEAGIEIDKMNKLGILDFEYQDDSGNMEVHIFCAKEFEGSPTESEEMKPKWFYIDKIPYDQMWSDDKYWLPIFLDGKKFEGKFFFNEANEIIDYSLLEIN